MTTPPAAKPTDLRLGALYMVVSAVLFASMAASVRVGPYAVIGAEVEPVTGYTAEEFMTGAVSWKAIIHPDDQVGDGWVASIGEALDEFDVVVSQLDDRDLIVSRIRAGRPGRNAVERERSRCVASATPKPDAACIRRRVRQSHPPLAGRCVRCRRDPPPPPVNACSVRGC